MTRVFKAGETQAQKLARLVLGIDVFLTTGRNEICSVENIHKNNMFIFSFLKL